MPAENEELPIAFELSKRTRFSLNGPVKRELIKSKFRPLRRATGLTAAFALIALAASAADVPVKTDSSEIRLPTAKDVIAKHLKAVGGRETILKHTSTRFRGRWDMPSLQGAGGEFELVQAKPNKRLMRMKMGETGEIVNGYNGKVGWVTSPFAPPALMEGKLLEQARHDADYYAALHNPTNYQSMETVARTRFDNRDCYELKVNRSFGQEVREFYDANTGLLAGTRGIQETTEGTSEIVATLLEYQKFGDLLQVTNMKIGIDQQVVNIRISSVDYDTVPDAEFELPAEIKELLKK